MGDLSSERSLTRDQILEFQSALSEFEQLDLPVKHHFAPGVYAREIFMPAGSIVVGKIHKHAHHNVISMGRVTVATEFGREELSAPCHFVSMPGTKRSVFVHDDCIWTTFHVTDKTELDEIERDVIAESFDDYDLFSNRLTYTEMKGLIV